MVIGKRLLILVIFLFSIFSAAAEENDCMVYFYGTNCAECARVTNHLNVLKTKYPLRLSQYEVHQNLANARTLEQYFQAYRIPESSRGLPIVFMPGSYFVGSSSILNTLENRILDNTVNVCPSIEGSQAIGLVGAKEPYRVLDTVTLGEVTQAAFKDAFRPGMLALMLILLMMLSSLRKKENVLQRGIISIVVIAVISMLFGLGLLFQAPAWISKIIGIFAIIASLIRIKGFFGTWKIVFEGISEKTETKLINLIRYLFTPIGFVILIFILAVLSSGKVSENLELLRMLTLEGVYNFKIFSYVFYHTMIVIILPVIMVMILFRITKKLDLHAQGKEPYNDAKAEQWRSHTQKVLRFTVSSIMLILGFILLFT